MNKRMFFSVVLFVTLFVTVAWHFAAIELVSLENQKENKMEKPNSELAFEETDPFFETLM